MDNNNNIYVKKPGSGKVFVGLLLLFWGGVLLLQQVTGLDIPNWIWNWPTWLILIGLWTGAKHNFRNSGWLIMVIIGAIFMADEVLPWFDLHHVVWPMALIAFGIWIIVGRHDRFGRDCTGRRRWKPVSPAWEANYVVDDPNNPAPTSPATDAPAAEGTPGAADYKYDYQYKYQYKWPNTGTDANRMHGDDYVNTTSVFGSVNKAILSKDFKGGEIVNVFGGTELNFTQADINGKVFIDVTQLFGGIKLIVPPHWQVTSDMAAVFAGIDDKRRPGSIPLSDDKILVLKGTSIFAGVEIRSY